MNFVRHREGGNPSQFRRRWAAGDRTILAILALAVLAGCHPGNQIAEKTAPGRWTLAEINGEQLAGSSIDLRLDNFDEEKLSFTGYRIGIRCDDDGRWNASDRLYVSNARNPSENSPTNQCYPEDAARQDVLRSMTHKGVDIQIDKTDNHATVTTASRESARFNFDRYFIVD